ncbi:GbpC/Spa domain-containing protein [Lactobacillus helveticus]|uniref:GbpC/Spa domain-containing protein n=1 Tax=Lactobacillus helveticus TaxID=1587 RepID=UPI0002F3B9FF|nr:hypothetical protein [Lactobacillus helveticus]NRN83869.1 hypothetical protein [Lactobacillus helveticus]
MIYSNNVAKNQNENSRIYFGDNLLNGFFYKNSKGMTMSMKLYDAEGKLITLRENSAYMTIGSLNSDAGHNNEYIEKAEIINSDGHYGSGVALPESSVTVHQGANGNDILYADKNNELLYDDKITQAERKQAIDIWGKEIVEKYLNWDSSTDRSKEIFGAGLFKVWGNGITIRFSNEIGSAWATYSTTVPKLGFNMDKPELDPLDVTYTSGKIVLDKSNVYIHYVDVHEHANANPGKTEFLPEHGIEIDGVGESFLDHAIGANYEHTLWDWLSHGYELATLLVDDNVKGGTVKEGDQHYYVYLKHGMDTNASRDKVVNQEIKYIYENGETAAPDYKGV